MIRPKRFIQSAAVCAALAVAPITAAASTLTLINSFATAQVAKSNTPAPNNLIETDPIFVSINEPALGGFASADALAGLLRFSTSTAGLTGVFGTTNTASLNYSFRYNGAAPLVLPEGALQFTVDAALSRQFPQTSAQVLSAATNFNSTLTSSAGFGGNVQGVARISVSEATNGNGNVTPITNDQNVTVQIGQLDSDGVAATYLSRATTLNDGQILQFQVQMSGNASQSGVNPSGVTATVDASNTGALQLILPSGVDIGGLAPGQSLSWVTTEHVTIAPVPLPAGAPLLLAGLLALGTFARRSRAT